MVYCINILWLDGFINQIVFGRHLVLTKNTNVWSYTHLNPNPSIKLRILTHVLEIFHGFPRFFMSFPWIFLPQPPSQPTWPVDWRPMACSASSPVGHGQFTSHFHGLDHHISHVYPCVYIYIYIFLYVSPFTAVGCHWVYW